MLGFPWLTRRLPRSRKLATEIHISYEDGRGLLRSILIRCTELRFAIDRVRLGDDRLAVERALDLADQEGADIPLTGKNIVRLAMLVKGKRPVSHLIAALSDINGIFEVALGNEELD